MNLWEVDHAYYCNEGNYYARGNEQPVSRYRTWGSFMEEEGESDPDYNLLFRWDWREGGDWGHGSEFTGDPNYRNAVLILYWMGQRKGLYRWSEVEVCRADEPAIRAFLQRRLDYLLALWSPLQASAIEAATAGETGTGSTEGESAVPNGETPDA